MDGAFHGFGGTPKSSMFIGFFHNNNPFGGTLHVWNPQKKKKKREASAIKLSFLDDGTETAQIQSNPMGLEHLEGASYPQVK